MERLLVAGESRTFDVRAIYLAIGVGKAGHSVQRIGTETESMSRKSFEILLQLRHFLVVPRLRLIIDC